MKPAINVILPGSQVLIDAQCRICAYARQKRTPMNIMGFLIFPLTLREKGYLKIGEKLFPKERRSYTELKEWNNGDLNTEDKACFCPFPPTSDILLSPT